MRHSDKKTVLKDFRRIPGVGENLSEDFWDMGLRSVDEMRGGDPEKLYNDFCRLKGHHVDRCVLYVFRCSVYFATENNHDPELLKWWSWKD